MYFYYNYTIIKSTTLELIILIHTMNWSPDQVAIALKQLNQYKTTLHKYQQLLEQDKFEATPEQQQMEAVLQRIAQIKAQHNY